MSKTITAISLVALMWVLPVQTGAAFPPETAPELRASLKHIGFSQEIIPASGRFSLRIGPHGSFAFGRFGGRGFHKFGNRGFHPYKYGGYRAYKYGHYPYLYRGDRFYADRFFSDSYSRFGSPNTYYSPFGTRRPGW